MTDPSKLKIRFQREIAKDEEQEFIAEFRGVWADEDPRLHPKADEQLYVVTYEILEGVVYAAAVLVRPGQTLEEACAAHFRTHSYRNKTPPR